MKLNLKNKNRGFTMIELIIVIAILGILAVFALPRFANVTNNAKTATRDGVLASLNSANAIAHAQWISQSSTGTVTLDGGSPITMTSSGWPAVHTTYNSAALCNTLVTSMLSNTSGLTITYDSYVMAGCMINNPKWASPIAFSGLLIY